MPEPINIHEILKGRLVKGDRLGKWDLMVCKDTIMLPGMLATTKVKGIDGGKRGNG